MIGALIIAFVVIVMIPVGFLMTMAAVSAIFGVALKTNADELNAESELVAHNY